MQRTDQELRDEANVIGNETTKKANTADRMRKMLINIIDSKQSGSGLLQWGGIWNFEDNDNAFPTAVSSGTLFIAEDKHGAYGDQDFVDEDTWFISKVADASTFQDYSYI